MRPLVLNAWGATSRAESRVCVESTTAPSEVAVYGPTRLPGGDYLVSLHLLGLGLCMAPDDILVADGLVRRVRVSEGPRPAGTMFAQSTCVRLDVVLEHEVGPTWTIVPGMPVATEFSFPRGPLAALFSGRVIAVDPGHGGKDTGLRGPVNLLEKNIVLETGLLLQRMLAECGAAPLMSRDRDRDVEAHGWTMALSAARPELLVEIHASGEKDPMARSYRVCARRGSEESALAARKIADALTERMGITFIRGIEESDFVAIPLWPAVRVEPLCLTHFVDEANFRAPLFRKRMAQAIFNGISRYFAVAAEGGAESVG